MPLTVAWDEERQRGGRRPRAPFAFLRAINLASHRRITSAKLRSTFEGLGFRDVATFRTSGNVVFEAGRKPRPELTRRIETGLAESVGFEVATFVRTTSETQGRWPA